MAAVVTLTSSLLILRVTFTLSSFPISRFGGIAGMVTTGGGVMSITVHAKRKLKSVKAKPL